MSRILQEFEGLKHVRMKLLIGGLAVGIGSGLVITVLRLGIVTMNGWMRGLLALAEENTTGVLAYAVVMALLGAAVALCSRLAPLTGGGGIPQVAAQLSGRILMQWRRVLPAKFLGCLLTLGSGLTMGRLGPSVQLGAVVGQACGELAGRPLSERNFLLSSGAAAGLAASFNAPIAGVVFALEGLHKSFSPIVLAGSTAAAFASAYIAASIMGIQPVLRIAGHELLPLGCYWLIVPLGLAAGLSGVLFNRCLLWSKALFGRMKLPWYLNGVVPFALTAAFCLMSPELFGNGEPMIFYPMGVNPPWGHLLRLYGLKLFLLALAFGGGLPGGIFFPLLVLGSLLGNTLGQAAAAAGIIDRNYVLTITLMAMAGHFSSIVRCPLTGILLVSEMTGSFAFMLPLGVVSMIAYSVAELCHCAPIYESLQRLLPLTGSGVRPTGPRMLLEFSVEPLSRADGQAVADILWPLDSLIVEVDREGEAIVPHGDLRLRGGDYLLLLTPEESRADVQEQLERLTRSGV